MIRQPLLAVLTCVIVSGCIDDRDPSHESEPPGRGPYAVASTNIEVAPQYAEIGDAAMHDILLGNNRKSDKARFVTDILRYPEASLVIDVPIPDDSGLYGPASGQTLPVPAYVTYPSDPAAQHGSYAFPYHDASYGIFENMLGPGDMPAFADPQQRYPLIVLSHGASAHGIYDVGRAHSLASHGYIVAVPIYGDDRTATPDTRNDHVAFLRPLLTKALIDALIGSDRFGDHIDADNIGISGHSFGGFTALAIAGGPYLGNPATVRDSRIKAGVIAAPWVGDSVDGTDFFAFGDENVGLSRVTAPIMCLFGTRDEVTQASFILPAARRLAGPTYVIELVDQPHVFEAGSWQDRDNWEMLFFSAYLKRNTVALAELGRTRSMKGGNTDTQLFDYQK